MSYSKYQSISSNDLNIFIGPYNNSTAYTSSAGATSKIAALYGVGYGDRGYGQTAISLAPQTSFTKLSTTEWNNLLSAITVLANHQGTSASLLPPAITSYSNAQAHDGTGTYNIPSMISSVDTNRFNTNGGGSMTLTANALTITRATTWGAGNASITAVGQVSFASEDAARYFFNSGGEIRFVIAHPNTSTSQDTNWNTTLANIGTIKFGANATARTGTSGSPQAIGYYQLTTANQALITGIVGSGAYSTNTVTVQAKAVTITGANGAKGSQIQFTFTLADVHTNVNYDVVQTGTNVVFSHLRATAFLSGIAAPTFSTITNF